MNKMTGDKFLTEFGNLQNTSSKIAGIMWYYIKCKTLFVFQNAQYNLKNLHFAMFLMGSFFPKCIECCLITHIQNFPEIIVSRQSDNNIYLNVMLHCLFYLYMSVSHG